MFIVPTKTDLPSDMILFFTTGLAGGIIAGISIAAVVMVLASALFIYFGIYRKKRLRGAILLLGSPESSSQTRNGTGLRL